MNEIRAILINDGDNVATVTQEAPKGASVVWLRSGESAGVVSLGVPKYHKIAVADIHAGALVYKYGEVIGHATEDIPAGAWVHNHNITSGGERE